MKSVPINMGKLGICCLVFLVSFAVRYVLIADSPNMDKWIDVSIYIDGGQLIANNVNPYNFIDGMELRDSLRRDTVAYNYFTTETQERWDYYAASNLPLTLFYFGLIENVAHGDPFIYRLAFALSDCILVVLLTLFIVDYWPKTVGRLKYGVVLAIGVLSPVMLYHGVLLPEDKGVQILLMIGAAYFSKRRNLLLASLCLGWSIAFKGLGVFIAPLCLYYFISEPGSFRSLFNAKTIKSALFFTLATTIFALQPFILYYNEVFDMMLYRLDQNMNALQPTHGSIWRFIHAMFPESWQGIKYVTTILFLIINIVGVWRARFGLNIITASLLLWFVDISLLGGSLDRMNIGFVLIILLAGLTNPKAALLLTGYYVFAGFIIFFSGYAYVHKIDNLDPELMDSAFSLGFTSVYSVLLIYYTLKGRSLSAETIPAREVFQNT